MKKSAMLFFISVAASLVCHAIHLRGGEIRIEQLSATSLSYRITVLVYVNTIGTNEQFGGEDAWLDFGDGNKIQIPETPAELSPDNGTGLSRASFTIEHTYPGYQSYLVSYSEPNRSEGVVNFTNSVSTKLFLESAIIVGGIRPQYFSPINYAEPSFNASLTQPYSCAFTCYDKNQARLTYELVTPHEAQNVPVLNYHLPGNVKINATSGLVTWDTKSETIVPGLYSLAIKVSQFNAEDELIGWIVKDMEILLRESALPITLVAREENMKHDLLLTEGSAIINEIAGTSKNVVLFANVYSELIGNSAMTLQQSDSSSDDARFINIVVTVKSNENIKRKTPYAVVIRAKTGPSQIVDDVYLIYTDSFYMNPLPAVTSVVEEGPITIFPNPAANFIEIQRLGAMDHMELLTATGQRVEINVTNSTIDVRNLPNGLYLLIIEAGGKKSVYRVVKK
jgi:hypothetical protein